MFYASINSNERIQFSKMKMKQRAIRCRILSKSITLRRKIKSKNRKKSFKIGAVYLCCESRNLEAAV